MQQPIQEEILSPEALKAAIKNELPKGASLAIATHNDLLKSINAMEENLDSLSPFQIAKLEHYYNRAEREAWKIAGYYKSQYQFYFGRAATERGQSYVYERETNKRAINDSNYASRIVEGVNLEKSGIYEGYFVTWRGIALSYQGMQNTLKDMLKAIMSEGGA
ncbi:Uncharacterised protein [Niallia circulans]|uniref:hypothetical protein n=1 Tax=Niallia circulans TaxID=1397 RepID=UPI00077CBC78|nr:hypothetical protein [Niallia circulans]MDR4315003.1 hypothetical protein [Niallia circulans]MED3839727.1 hypothetical protein [Niallia circulans]MED4241212.1 hypothetical protein [Niallia circulans]MED4247873.1 hypothetical protein [Niallia circulans]QKH61644.1 hypothetical protein FOC77_13790 [Niallia circulans]